jgi:hypothetical protein
VALVSKVEHSLPITRQLADLLYFQKIGRRNRLAGLPTSASTSMMPFVFIQMHDSVLNHAAVSEVGFPEMLARYPT